MDWMRALLGRHLPSASTVVHWREGWRYRLGASLPGRREAAERARPAGSQQLVPLFTARSRQEFDAAMQQARLPDLASHRDALLAGKTLRLRRFCLCCGETTPMLADLRGSYDGGHGERIPNWRERLVCPRCGLNNRQRLVARLVQQQVAAQPSSSIYLMEQVTPIYEWVRRRLPQAQVHGSEYLGPQVRGGTSVRGVRHEDVMQLSWPDCSFDLVVSNDVLEHVPDPVRALHECFRVLKPGGAVLATFPFHVSRPATVVRARLTGDGIEHLLPAQYHGNPLSAEGSLVFQDFGWDLLDRMADAGFSPAACEVYASDDFGHLGPGLLVFRLSRPLG